MDRKKVRDRVFADPAAKRKLEALLHPMIREDRRRRIAAAAGPTSCSRAAAHRVADYRRRVDRVLVVDCPRRCRSSARAQRASEDEVRAIMAPRRAR